MKTPEAYPPMELKVLHGVLVNDSLQWIDKANTLLSEVGSYPKALIPLNLQDFTHPETRAVMSMILRAHSENNPIHAHVQGFTRNGIYAGVYHRLIDNPDVEPVFNITIRFQELPLPYETFIRAVYTLRRNRLERDLAQGLVPQEDILEWQMARRALSVSKMRV